MWVAGLEACQRHATIPKASYRLATGLCGHKRKPPALPAVIVLLPVPRSCT